MAARPGISKADWGTLLMPSNFSYARIGLKTRTSLRFSDRGRDHQSPLGDEGGQRCRRQNEPNVQIWLAKSVGESNAVFLWGYGQRSGNGHRSGSRSRDNLVGPEFTSGSKAHFFPDGDEKTAGSYPEKNDAAMTLHPRRRNRASNCFGDDRFAMPCVLIFGS